MDYIDVSSLFVIINRHYYTLLELSGFFNLVHFMNQIHIIANQSLVLLLIFFVNINFLFFLEFQIYRNLELINFCLLVCWIILWYLLLEILISMDCLSYSKRNLFAVSQNLLIEWKFDNFNHMNYFKIFKFLQYCFKSN